MASQKRMRIVPSLTTDRKSRKLKLLSWAELDLGAA